MFNYIPQPYAGEVIVYEAKVTPLLSLPQIGRIWRKFASQAQIVRIVGTHIGMMHEPYVDALAEDICGRVGEFFTGESRQQS
jgi:thioesterase domain-containing protein